MSKDVHFFAQDGSFGHAEGIVIIETDQWEEDDWDMVADAPDSRRAAVAMAMATWIRLDRPKDFWTHGAVPHPKYRNEINLAYGIIEA